METDSLSEGLEDDCVVFDLLMLVLEAVVIVQPAPVVDFLTSETDTKALDLLMTFLRVVGAFVVRLVSEATLLPGSLEPEYKDVPETLLEFEWLASALERPIGWVSIVETVVSTALQPIEVSIITKTAIHALIRSLLKNMLSSSCQRFICYEQRNETYIIQIAVIETERNHFSLSFFAA